MKMKKLKLPDGGSFDLQMPAGFGDSIGATTDTGRTTTYIVGTIAGAVAGFLIIYAAEKITAAVERR